MIVSSTNSNALLVAMEGMRSHSDFLFLCCQFELTNIKSQVMTGSYHNYFRIYDVDGSSDVILQADKSAFKTAKKVSLPFCSHLWTVETNASAG